MSNNWASRGKTLAGLVKELESFENQQLEVRISVDGGQTSYPISLVGRHEGKYALLENCEDKPSPLHHKPNLTIQVVLPGKRMVYVAGAGLVGCVYPGGRYLGFSFDELLALGTGEHHMTIPDAADFRQAGDEPVYEREFDRQLDEYRFCLFGYQVGLYTAAEMLHIAAKLLATRNATE